MSETTQEERDQIKRIYASGGSTIADWLLRLSADADRLAAIERDILNLADEEMEAARYEKTVNPDRAYRQRCRARRLRAIIDAGGEG